MQQAGLAGSGGGREAVNPSSGATVVNADVIREAVQDFLQRQVPASSAQTMMNGSALVSPVHDRCCSLVSSVSSGVLPLRGVVVASCYAFCLKQVLCMIVKDRSAGADTLDGSCWPLRSWSVSWCSQFLGHICFQLRYCAAGGGARD